MQQTPRDNVLQFIQEARSIPKPPKENALAAFSDDAKNSIFNQKTVISLNPVAFERLALAELELQKAALALMGAEAALVGFDEIEKRDLGLAQNFTHGYIYMLREFVYQAKVRREVAAVQKVRGYK